MSADNVSLSPQLSPWDLTGVSFDFGLYRPRRPSYLFATRTRRRTSSYRSATRDDSDLEQSRTEDFVEEIVQKRRKESYKRANKHEDHDDTEIDQIHCRHDVTHTTANNHLKPPNDCHLAPNQITIALNDKPIDLITTRNSYCEGENSQSSSVFETDHTCNSTQSVSDANIKLSKWIYRKNMFVMCISFILVFTVFRSIQNLQSSLNKENKLGIISMCCVYSTMFLTCLLVPVVIQKIGAKWAIVLGLLFYHFWIAANFYPHFCTLIPTSIAVGLGQSLAWTGQVSYLTKLATDYTFVAKDVSDYDIYKFNGIFLACFQTTHIWGNLVSSMMLHVVRPNTSFYMQLHQNGNEDPTYPPPALAFPDDYREDFFEPEELCGVFDDCLSGTPHLIEAVTKAFTLASNSVIKLMGAHLVLAFLGFVLIILFLDRIGAKGESDQSVKEMVSHNILQMFKDKTFRLLAPLLIFNGFEQGFLYADFNKSFVSCPLGIEYIGFAMITLGASNVISSMAVGVLARHMPREVIVGIAGIMHIGLMVFLLIWIPTKGLMVLIFISAALWGVCDAVWQTQCNVLISVSCPEEHDVAFTNFRVLQALGASLAFGLGTGLCVATKMYILISLLVCAMMFYAIAEYRIKQMNGETDDVISNSEVT